MKNLVAGVARQRSVDLAITQYRDGAIDFNRVFNLQTALVTDQDTLATVEGNVARSLVETYRALGGGWEIRYGIRRGASQPLPVVDAVEPEPVDVVPEDNRLPPVPDDADENNL